MELYLYQNDQQVGPYDEDQLRNMVATGAISDSDPCWQDGMAEWQPLNTVLLFEEPALVTPPLTEGRKVSQTRNAEVQELQTNVKQGAVIGGWVCFGLGIGLMFMSMLTFVIYGPLFLVAFILSIVAMSQRRVFGGLILLLASLIVPTLLGIYLLLTRTTTFGEIYELAKTRQNQREKSQTALSEQADAAEAITPVEEASDVLPPNTDSDPIPAANNEPSTAPPVVTLPTIAAVPSLPLTLDELTPTDGTKFKDVTITRAEPDGIVITHSDGIAKIPYTALAQELRSKFPYDPQKAAEFQAQQQVAAEARRQAAKAAEIKAENDTLVAKESRRAPTGSPVKTAKESRPAPTGPPVKLVGQILQHVPGGGLLIQCSPPSVVADGLASIGGGGGVSGPEGGDVFGTFVLRGHPKEKSIADDESVKVYAVKDGTYQGTTILGAKRTIRTYQWVPGSAGKPKAGIQTGGLRGSSLN